VGGRIEALVTDAHVHPSVWAIRAFGATGMRVRAMGPGRTAPGLWSRAAASRTVAPAAERDPVGYARAVATLAERHGPLVVYPAQEESIEALLHADLPDTALTPWPVERLDALRDKRRMAVLAAGVGIATPAQLCEATAAEVRTRSLDGPTVVKPVRKSAMPMVKVVRTAEELRAAIADVADHEPLILQRRAEGDLIGLTLLIARDGRPVARIQQRTHRTWPPDAGASSLVVTEPVDEDLAAASVRMLAAAGFHGLVQLQFMVGDGPPQLIDANPRYYGSLSLALRAGVNLPALWHAVVTGERLPSAPPRYEHGISYRHVWLDLTAALHGDLGVLRRAPSPSVGAMWQSRDPAAGAMLAARAAFGYGRRQTRRIRRAAIPRRRAGGA
jgi:predicted ATP-grasp superfamily ATP-dependent carboligase